MATDFSCDLNTLILASACLSDNCMSQSDRDAFDIWVRIKALAAAGGTDYTSNLKQLMADSAIWRLRPPDTLKAVESWIDLLSANEDGAGLGTDARGILKSAHCLRGGCLGKEDAKGIKSFLKCAIQTIGVPT